MQKLRTVFAQKLHGLIEQEIESKKDELAYGGAVSSYEQYRERVGFIQGLQAAAELCDAAEEAADAHERGDTPKNR